jgi:hypothetical protein
LFTAEISDSTVISTSVNLLKVDPTGKPLAAIGHLRDDGLNGDLAASDKLFSARVLIDEPVVGQIHYQVSAAFRGVLRRAISPRITVHVDPFPLPPEPGEAGKQTLEGIDLDTDGVRDDVQRWIALEHPSKPSVRGALTQLALANQEFIKQSESDLATLQPIVLRRHAAQECLYHVNDGNIQLASDQRVALRSILLNTSQRSRAYLQADSKLGGLSFTNSDPAGWGDSCE